MGWTRVGGLNGEGYEQNGEGKDMARDNEHSETFERIYVDIL